MFVIGLTGGVGTGKSTVAEMFAQLGAAVLDADKIVHQALQPQGACYRRVVKEFGIGILRNETIDRRKLGAIVFRSRTKLKKLERMIHPVVRRRMFQKMYELKKKKQKRMAVLEIPLLFESKMKWPIDASVVVVSDQAKQIKRSMKRLGISKAEAMRRLKAQMPLRQKIRLADFIIDNRGTKKQTERQVKILWQKIL